jgi:prepilin-type N-terminal cleavage/methylation domain-containing protein
MQRLGTRQGKALIPGRRRPFFSQGAIYMKNRAFTLIELLVVIAIIAILAAILFPVFAQAKDAAKKTADLSNHKNTALAVIMYAGDYDDTTPPYGYNEYYIIPALIQPYTKNKAIFQNPKSPYKIGAANFKQMVNYGSATTTNYAAIPDLCYGLPHSVDGPGGYYADVYPPTDFEFNDWLTNGGAQFGNSSCADAEGDQVNGGWFNTGISLTGGKILDPAHAVFFIDFPFIGTEWPGSCQSASNGACQVIGDNFWGNNFQGYYTQGSNLDFTDGHAKYYKTSAITNGANADWDAAQSLNPWSGPIASWRAWGLQGGVD